jgi:hypothetical protein
LAGFSGLDEIRAPHTFRRRVCPAGRAYSDVQPHLPADRRRAMRGLRCSPASRMIHTSRPDRGNWRINFRLEGGLTARSGGRAQPRTQAAGGYLRMLQGVAEPCVPSVSVRSQQTGQTSTWLREPQQPISVWNLLFSVRHVCEIHTHIRESRRWFSVQRSQRGVAGTSPSRYQVKPQLDPLRQRSAPWYWCARQSCRSRSPGRCAAAN